MSWETPSTPYAGGYVASMIDDTVVVEYGEGVRWNVTMEDMGMPQSDKEASFEKLVDALSNLPGFTLTRAARDLSSSQIYTPTP